MVSTIHRIRLVRLVVLAALAALLATAAPLAATSAPITAATPSPPSTAAASTIDPAVARVVEADGAAKVVIRYGEASPASVDSGIVATGGHLGHPLPIIDGVAATITAEGLELLRTLGVAAVTFDGRVQLAHGSSTEPVPADTTVRQTVGAARLHKAGVTGKGVGIAMIDTGANAVGDLAGRVAEGVDLTADLDSVDRFGHGTLVAGVAAGGTYGIAPGAHVVPVKIASSDGSADVSHVLAGIQWVVSHASDRNIRVLNLSLGTDSSQDWRIDPLNYAVERAWDAGIVVVVSASNAGPDASTVTKPADDPWVIAVGATDGEGTTGRTDDTLVASSGRGPTRSGGLAKPDLVAPGAHVLGTRAPGSTIDAANPGARYGDGHLQATGTSFSAAVTSGAVALLREAKPRWSPDEVKGALLATAVPGPLGDPNADGQGALDVLAAAQLKKPPVANQGLSRSNASGTLGAARGSLSVAITDTVEQVVETLSCTEQLLSGGLLGGLIKTVVCVTEETIETTTVLLGVLDSTTEVTAQNKTFDAKAYVQDPWTAASWTGSQWYGSQWYGSQWYGSQWYGSQWYGSQWYGSQWYGGAEG